MGEKIIETEGVEDAASLLGERRHCLRFARSHGWLSDPSKKNEKKRLCHGKYIHY